MSLAMPEYAADFNEGAVEASFQPSYELDAQSVHELSAQLLEERPTHTKDRFVVYEFDADDQFSNLGRSIEADVFNKTFDDKIDDMEEGYGPYEAASTFFVVMDQKDKKPVGAMRIIRNSEKGFKTLNDIAGKLLNISTEDFMKHHGVASLDNCWDVGTVAVLPDYRTSQLKSGLSKDPQPNILLYRSLYAKARYEGVEHFVSVIDDKALRGLKLLGVPFVPINDSPKFAYMGSKSSNALYGYVPEFYEKMEAQYAKAQELHPYKSSLLARPLGQLMLGEHTDEKLFLNY